jgi:hypothetical protein
MDSISNARDFFINQQGLSPDQADMIVSKGMEAYNQQSQPQQNMMQMASGGIARLGYQMGGSPMGVGTMPMDTGQSLQVPQQMPTNFSSAQSITSNPLLNYGQPQIGQAGGTPLSMNRGGIARLGYESGGVTLPSQGSEMAQMQGMDGQQALQTIIQILIENGIPPEQAQQLALQILQIFAQGGEPALEEFANQLEQQESQAMASGGVAGYGYRQGYGFGGIGKIFSGAAKAVSGVVKGVASAVKAVAKSPIGRAALTIGAATFLGPGAFGFSGLGLTGAGLGFATAGANLGLQALGGQKLNLLEAGLSGFSAGLSNPTVPASSATNITTSGVDVAGNALKTAGVANTTIPYSGLEADISSMTAGKTLPSGAANYAYTPNIATITPEVGLTAPGSNIYNVGTQTQPGIMQTLQDKVTSAFSNPMDTLKNVATSAYDYAKENPITTAIGVSSLASLGAALGMPRNEGEDDESYGKRLAETQGYITQYGRNLQIKNPYFYQREGAVNPFAPTMAANGGIMGYKKGGSMIPPARQIEGGVIELDARKSGGYIPYGKKERVDDVPAMLAKDEFVFTSRAVKAAGGGSAKRGAEKMYALMKQLESKGARA